MNPRTFYDVLLKKYDSFPSCVFHAIVQEDSARPANFVYSSSVVPVDVWQKISEILTTTMMKRRFAIYAFC